MFNADAHGRIRVSHGSGTKLSESSDANSPFRRFALVVKEKPYTGCLQRIVSTSAVITAASMMGISMAPAMMDAQDLKASSELVSSSASADPGDDPQPGETPGFIGPRQTTAPQQPKRHLYDPARIDVSLGVFPQLTGTRTVENVSTNTFGSIVEETTQGTTPSPGVLGTFHQQLTHWIGYETSFGYTRLAENYLSAVGYNGMGGDTGGATAHSISSDVYELSLAVVAKGPVSSHRMQTFLDGGSGVLLFRPTRQPLREGSQVRAMVLFGAGIDYRLSDHFGIRAEYRGMFYKNPDFRNPNIVATKLFTVTNEPTISLVYRFGAYKRMQ
jgi:opacity protein-like surface antigen